MLCPYGNEVGDPARRALCPARAQDGGPEVCYCEFDMAMMDGRRTHDGETGELLIDQQTYDVQQFWVAAEDSVRAAADAAAMSERPTL